MSNSRLKHFVVHSILVLALVSCTSQAANSPTAIFVATALEATATAVAPIQIPTWTSIPMQASTITNPTELPEPTADPTMFAFDSFHMTSETAGWGTTTLPDTQGEIWTQHIVHTRDGALNWQDVSPTIIENLKDFFILDDDHAWILTETYWDSPKHILSIWGTQDGGQTWQQAIVPYFRWPEVTYMTFEDTQHGLVEVLTEPKGVYQPFKTSDGGMHWEVLPSTTTNLRTQKRPSSLPPAPGVPELPTNWRDCSPYYDSRTFFSAQEGIFQVLCSENLLIYHTHDGGQTWDTPAHRGDLLTASLIDFVDMNNGWYLATEDNPSNLKGLAFYVTYDGGKTSSEIIPVIIISETHDLPYNPAETLGNLNFMDQKTGFAVTTVGFYTDSNSVILKTTDGGYTWNGWVPHLLPAAPGH